MKKTSLALRILCASCAVLTLLSATACKKNKTVSDVSTNVVSGDTPKATAEPFGTMTSEGYELPYEYKDDHKATMKVPDGSEYVTVSTTPSGNKVIHMTTTKSVDEVNKFYDEYFKELTKVKAKNKKDNSKGYYDKDAELVLFNLNVWTAEGKTNFKLGTEACANLKDSKVWEKE